MPYVPTLWEDSPSTDTPITAARLNNMEDGISNALELADPVQIGTALNLDASDKLFQASAAYETGSTSTRLFGLTAEARVRGTSPTGPSLGFFGLEVAIEDHPSVGSWAVSGAANNGSGLIRLTTASHTITTGDSVGVYGVTGATQANGYWLATVIDSTHVDLQGSAFSSAYVSGGTITNRGAYYGAMVSLGPTEERGGLTGTAEFGDDIGGYGVFNHGTVMAGAAYLVNRNSSFGAGNDFYIGYAIEANVAAGLSITSDCGWGIDLYGNGTASYSEGPILLPNTQGLYARNGAGNANIPLLELNAGDELQTVRNVRFAGSQVIFQAGETIYVEDGVNFGLGTSTGMKIGTATTQKIGFWNATPVVRPTGWGAPTGTPTRTTFATGSVTLPQLAERVKALIDDLTTEGLIGA